jgi:signal transduction histidine kinase
MKKYLNNLLVGKNQKFDSRVAYERTLLTAQLLALGTVVMIMYSVLDMIAGLHQTFRFSIPFLFVLISCFWLIRTGRRTAAKIIFLLSANLVLFAYASTASFATGTSFYFIVASIAALVLFGYEERTLAILFPLLSLGLFIISYFTDIRPFKFVHLSDALILRSFVINFFATLIASTFEVLFLMRVNHYSEKDIKEREQKILEQNQELLKTNSDLDRFVYSASHDLRAPLSSIMGLVHLSKLTTEESELRKYLEMIGSRVKDLDRVTKDILNYSKNARTEIQSEEVDIEEIIQQVWDELRFDLNASSIKLVKSLPEKMIVKTDKDRLKIILSNLFSNAIKYANTTLEHPRVVSSGEIINNFFLLEIADNGIGIATQHQSRIFDMFYRATEKSNGSGLGLFIVKETIDKLKGEIAMTSEFGKGTSFKIKIPIHNI